MALHYLQLYRHFRHFQISVDFPNPAKKPKTSRLPDLRKVIFLYLQFHLLDLQQTGLAAKDGQKSSPLLGSQDPSPDFQLKCLSQFCTFFLQSFCIISDKCKGMLPKLRKTMYKVVRRHVMGLQTAPWWVPLPPRS